MKAPLTDNAELMRELAVAQAWPARKPRAGIKPPTPVRFDSKLFALSSRLDAAAPGTPEWRRIFAEVRFFGRALDLAVLRRAMWGRT